jgi:phospholipase C
MTQCGGNAVGNHIPVDAGRLGGLRRQRPPSCLKFCEVVTGVPATNLSAWRRQTVSDFTGAFVGLEFDPAPPVFPDTVGELRLASYTSKLPPPSIPGACQTFPVLPSRHHRHTR